MTMEQSNDESEGHLRWGRARTDSAFQSTASVAGPSASPYFNGNNEVAYSPVVSATSKSGLSPPLGSFELLDRPPASHIWANITGLPAADLSPYSLQAHRGTHVAHGNITLDTFWDRRRETSLPQYDRPSITAAQTQSIPLQVATSTYAQSRHSSLPRTPLPSVSEGVLDRPVLNATNRLRPTPSLIPINVDVANGRVTSPQSPYTAPSSEPETALLSPAGGGIAWRDPFGGAGSGLRSPETAASPLDQAISTPQLATAPQSPLPDAVQTPQTPSRRRRLSKIHQERELNQEEKDFILYLSLQGIRSEAVGLELSRISPQHSTTMAIDARGKSIGRIVVACLMSFSECTGTEEDAEQIVSGLMLRAEREGWGEGPLSRGKEYSHSLSRGKSIASDIKGRKHDARCRAAHKKWRINHPQTLPREDARTQGEKMAFLGMLLEGTAQEADGPTKEELKKNLLELWENCTIAGKAVR